MITTDTHVYFYTGIYSNWHRSDCQFVDPNTNLPFNTTEQAFMWYKATFFGDTETASKIAAETHPKLVKELGRLVKNYNDKAWECVRLGYMTYVIYLKFTQNPEWAKELKATGNKTLVEASPYDKIWGIGLSVEEAASGKMWQGRNLLGEALENVRGML